MAFQKEKDYHGRNTTLYIDTSGEVDNLPHFAENIAPGSTAVVVNEGLVYMLNNDDEWVVFG